MSADRRVLSGETSCHDGVPHPTACWTWPRDATAIKESISDEGDPEPIGIDFRLENQWNSRTPLSQKVQNSVVRLCHLGIQLGSNA